MKEEVNDVLATTRPCMLTTIDNPFSPFTQWDQWLRYDRDHGYYTNEYLARVADADESLSTEQYRAAIRKAMYNIAENNPTNLWVLRFEEEKLEI